LRIGVGGDVLEGVVGAIVDEETIIIVTGIDIVYSGVVSII
jgi:hypothetical protein